MDQNPANMEHQDDASENLNQGNEMENENTSPVNEEKVVEETTEQVEADLRREGRRPDQAGRPGRPVQPRRTGPRHQALRPESRRG